MKVELAVTRSCHHCSLLESEFREMGIPYAILYLEDDPETQKKHGIKSSPNIIVDGEVVFRGMPSIPALREYFAGKKTK